MPNLTWLAQVVFFGSYFIAWCADELPHVTWISVSAWAALFVALGLLFFDAYPLIVRRTTPQA